MAQRFTARTSRLFSSPSSSGVNIDMSQFSKYPWLKQEYVDEIEKRTAGVPDLYKDSMQQQMYSDYYQKQMIDDQQEQRTAIKNQARQNSLNAASEGERKTLNTEIRKADLADLIRRKYKISTKAANDDTLIKKFVEQVPDWVQLYYEFIKWQNSNLLSKSWIISPVFAELNEKNKVTTRNGNVVSNAILKNQNKPQTTSETSLISSSPFDDEEYATKYIDEQDDSYNTFVLQARSKWYSDWEIASIIDWNKKYQQYLQNVEDYKNRSFDDKVGIWWELPLGIAQGFSNFFINTYNNLLGENETVGAFKPVEKLNAAWGLKTDYDPTGEMRANSAYTKWGDIVWKVWAAILTDQALLNLLPSMQAENLTAEWVKQIAAEWGKSAVKQAVLDRTLQWAAEWGLAWFVNSVWEEDAQKTMKTTVPLGISAWALGWYLQGNSAVRNAKLTELDNKVNTTSKNASRIVDKTDDANKIAGRIWQGDINDQSKVREWVRSLARRNWETNTKSIKTYKQLEDAIKNTKRQIISEEDELLKQYPDKITDWTTKQTVKWIGDQTDEVTRDYLDEGIGLLKKYNKNDPAALKELEILQNTKNTQWLTRLEAKQIARTLTSKLSKKFYNSNDELRNSMSAESYETIRKWIQNAVRDRLPNDTLKNLDIEYSNLRGFEDLTDDMAEKVNTLTQKLKNTTFLEKVGRKAGDLINRVTGKSIKWLVEKFLPSNMWNKINNSIDIQNELWKNLSKLVDLNTAIDKLNSTLNSNASQKAINAALNSFAKVVSEIQTSITTPAVTIVADEVIE